MRHVRVYSILCKFVTVNNSNHSLPEVEFHPLEADGADYPKSVIPILPPLSWDAWQAHRAVFTGSAFLQGGESYVQGRYALAEALQRAGAGPGTTVLLPAFHCRSMVEPALYLNAMPFFYPLRADLQPDFTALSWLIRDSEMPVVAMLLPHYFGFPNALGEAERLCASHGIALIEDCAHAFYGQAGGRRLGTVGSYAIASPWKFLPVSDGGVLRDNTGNSISRHIGQSWLAEAKAVAAMLQIWSQRVWHRCSLPVIEPEQLCEQAGLIAARSAVHVAESGIKGFLPERAESSSLRSSHWLAGHVMHERISQSRRENYLQWLEGVRELPGVEPLFPCLPEGVVPYAFPLLIDAEGMCFHLLKLAGMPLWRWEDMAVTDCAISRNYRVRLLQLPCHQGLRTEELAWMIRTVQTLLTRLVSNKGSCNLHCFEDGYGKKLDK